MPEEKVPAGRLVAPAFFRSEQPIRPRAKIQRRQIPAICLAFCRGVPVALAARQTGISEKTIRALYAGMRALLLAPRYRKWHGFDLAPVYKLPNIEEIEAELWSCFAACYFNQECFRNYQYGKRAERQCGVCPARSNEVLRPILTPELTGSMLELIETINAFYRVLLGLSQEETGNPAALFRLRAYHTTILLNARMASSTVENGIVKTDVRRRGPLTIRELWRVILDDIAERGVLEF